MDQGKAAYGEGKPEAARDAYQLALDEALRLVRSTVDGRLAAGRELAEAAKRLGGDPGVPLKKFSEAKALLDAEDYEGATRLIADGADAAREAARKVAEEALVAAQSNIEHSRKLGADTLKAGETLGRARAEMQAGNHEVAVELARGARDLIQMRLDSEKRFADKSFQAESMIRRAKKFGVEVVEAERILAEAIRAKKADPEKAMALAEEAQGAAHRAIESYSPDVAATLEVKEPVAGEWAEATLTLVNAAKAMAKDVKVKILGDAEVEGLKDVPALKGKGSESLPLRVRMTAAGSIPLAIQITSVRILDGKEYHREVIATVHVAEAPPPVEEKVQAETESRCPLCKGLIKVGFSIKRCPHCSKDMHELCSTRSPKCPACGNSLAAEGPKRKKIAFKVG
jgi:tetratricopeptide (TPR) repeat protein